LPVSLIAAVTHLEDQARNASVKFAAGLIFLVCFLSKLRRIIQRMFSEVSIESLCGQTHKCIFSLHSNKVGAFVDRRNQEVIATAGTHAGSYVRSAGSRMQGYRLEAFLAEAPRVADKVIPHIGPDLDGLIGLVRMRRGHDREFQFSRRNA